MKKTFFAVCAVLMLAGCDKTQTAQPAAAPETPAAAPQPSADAASAALMAPEKLTETAPATFKARFSTSKGDFVMQVERAWGPNGADRLYNLIKNGYYDGLYFFRVVSGFMAQFGVHGDPAINAKWVNARIPDDPVVQSNTRGMVTFATSGKDSRTTHLFISYGNNSNLDPMGFTPVGKVVSGMEVVDALFPGYGDGPPYGNGVEQGRLNAEGAAYLRAEFPKLDYIKSARLEP